MSSYLSFYIVPKRKSDTEKKQHIILTSFSRNSDIYQYFWENINPAYCGMEEKYTTLTKENVKSVIDDFEKDINSYQKRLTEYEKYADEPKYADGYKLFPLISYYKLKDEEECTKLVQKIIP